MGACVARAEEPRDLDEWLMSPAHLHRGDGGGCWAGRSSAAQQRQLFRHNVAFQKAASPTEQFYEKQVIKALMELCYIKYPGQQDTDRVGRRFSSADNQAMATISTISSIVNGMRGTHSDALYDLVVPITGVMLHLRQKVARDELWTGFVKELIETDIMLAHLFYWALNSVAGAPQTERRTKGEAHTYLEHIREVLGSSRRTTPARGVSGRLLAKLVEEPQDISPLIDLFERLNEIGREIVRERKGERETALMTKLEDVNDELLGADSQPVPLGVMAAGDASGRRVLAVQRSLMQPQFSTIASDTNWPARVLRLPATEAFTLSSKDRAPYHLLLEYEECTPVKESRLMHKLSRSLSGESTNVHPSSSHNWRRSLCCPCRSRPQRRLSHRRSGQLGSVSASGSSRPVLPQAENGNDDPYMESPRRSPSTFDDDDHNKVDLHLRENDPRPKGLFKTESWEQVLRRVQESSEFGKRKTWHMMSLIVKSNADDVRQEELAIRLLKWFQRVFKRHRLKLWLRPFQMIATCHDGAVLETVPNAISIDALKKSYRRQGDDLVSLKSYFEQAFPMGHSYGATSYLAVSAGSLHSSHAKVVSRSVAIMNYIHSMAAYSIVCYVLAVRDRHNGNIMLDDEGHIIHVDFGFMLSGTPGGKAMQKMGGWEPSKGFKLTKEFLDVLGGHDSVPCKIFREQVLLGMLAVREEADELMALLQLGMLGEENVQMGCFEHPRGYPEAVIEDVCERLGLPPPVGSPASLLGSNEMTKEEYSDYVQCMLDYSTDNWRSRWYDKYQHMWNGIL